MSGKQHILVVTDPRVLDSFACLGRFELIGRRAELRTLVPTEVLDQLHEASRRGLVEAAIESGELERAPPPTAAELADYAGLRRILGPADAAALAIARSCGAFVACEAGPRLLRLHRKLLGSGRVVNTSGLILRAIRRGQISVADGDQLGARLHQQNIGSSSASFGDLVAGART